jgi:hypothetical protein
MTFSLSEGGISSDPMSSEKAKRGIASQLLQYSEASLSLMPLRIRQCLRDATQGTKGGTRKNEKFVRLRSQENSF